MLAFYSASCTTSTSKLENIATSMILSKRLRIYRVVGKGKNVTLSAAASQTVDINSRKNGALSRGNSVCTASRYCKYLLSLLFDLIRFLCSAPAPVCTTPFV